MDSKCAACKTFPQKNERICSLSECRHVFHLNCLGIWLTSNRPFQCPCCFRPIDFDNHIKFTNHEIDDSQNNKSTMVEQSMLSSELQPEQDIGILYELRQQIDKLIDDGIRDKTTIAELQVMVKKLELQNFVLMIKINLEEKMAKIKVAQAFNKKNNKK